MNKKDTLKEGEVLLFLANRSSLSKQEIAENLKIHKGYLSNIFKNEKLSTEIKKRAAAFFGVDVSFFELGPQEDDPGAVSEPGLHYMALPSQQEQMKSVLKMMRDKHEQHCKEMIHFFALLEASMNT